jgi:hypothetical protein
LFEREEIMARQRSRVDWLREGDRNTAFFMPEPRLADEQIESVLLFERMVLGARI